MLRVSFRRAGRSVLAAVVGAALLNATASGVGILGDSVRASGAASAAVVADALFLDRPAVVDGLLPAVRGARELISNPEGDPPSGSSVSPSVPGELVPVGDLPNWRQIFVDDFATDVPIGSFPKAVSAQWGAYPSPWRDTTGDGLYAPKRVVEIADGVLTKHLRTEDGQALVAALTPRLPGTAEHGVTYGRFAVRFRADRLAGYKVAWLLWPDSGQRNRDGEIDFPEMNLDGANVAGYVHRRDASSGSDQAWAKAAIDVTAWHTAIIEWSPDLVVFILDGTEIGRTTQRVPNTPMHWVLQTETAINIPGPPAASVQGTVQVDWVAAWAYQGG